MCNNTLALCNAFAPHYLDLCIKIKTAQRGLYLSFFKSKIMSKGKEGKAKSGKKAPEKNLKEKRAAKAAKRAEKRKSE